jgi:pimeloyl-ACP methyl ester carboxylesterase
MDPALLFECDFDGTFPFRPHFALLGGHRLHYVDEGRGDPVVLLHGNPTWGYLYRKFVRPLAATGRVIVPDHLGFGKSDKPLEARFRLEDRIQQLDALLLDRLDLRNITLVVHEWGGPIGLGFAVRNPSRVRALIIANSWCHGLPEGTRLSPLLEQFRLPGLGEALVQGLNLGVEGMIPAGIHRKARITEELLHAYRAPFPDYNSRRHILDLARDIPAGERHPSFATIAAIAERLPALEARALIVRGEEDPFYGALETPWSKLLRHEEVRTIEEAGHYPQEDAPAEVLALLEEFLG